MSWRDELNHENSGLRRKPTDSFRMDTTVGSKITSETLQIHGYHTNEVGCAKNQHQLPWLLWHVGVVPFEYRDDVHDKSSYLVDVNTSV